MTKFEEMQFHLQCLQIASSVKSMDEGVDILEYANKLYSFLLNKKD